MPVINTPIIQSLKEEFKPYAQDVILNNLPMIDGLLLSHKKVLWGMYQKGTLPDKPFVKNIKNQGSIVEYYVYGDMPLAKVMVNMADNGINVPYLEWDGNSGDKYRKDGKPASARYTGSRLTKYGLFMLKGIEKNAVPMKPNYDNSSTEPIIAPSIAPNILINNSESIAISEASKIPPHNINSLCNSIVHYIKTNNIDESIDILECPDFINGGKIVFEKELFKKIYKEGKGSFSLIGKYDFNKDTGMVSVYEVPYTTTIDAIESAITKNYLKGRFKEVLDIRNASGKDGLKLNIQVKKNTNIKEFEKQLRKFTPFESKYSCNFTLLGLDYVPYLMNLEGIYSTWLQHRINCITNEINFDISKSNDELHLLYGLQKILLDLDKAISICRNSKSNNEAIEELMNYFNLSKLQAEYISNIRLVNLNKEYFDDKISKINSLELSNTKLKNSLDKNCIKETIIDQLIEFSSKHSFSRRTEIIADEEIENISKLDIITDYNTRIFVSSQGYIKKIPLTSLRGKGIDEQKLKEGDFIVQDIESTNKSSVMLFTDRCNRYKINAYELEDKKPSQMGEYIPNLIDLEPNEKVIKIVSLEDESKAKGYILSVYTNGKISKVDINSFISANKKLQNCYSTESELLDIEYIEKDVDVLMISSEGKGIIINSEDIGSKASRNSQGNIAMNLGETEDNKVISCMIKPNQNLSFTLNTEKGKSKEFRLDDIAPTGKDLETRDLYTYIKGRARNQGNFLMNLRSTNDSIKEVIFE